MELANIYEMSDRKAEALELVNKVLKIKTQNEREEDITGDINRRRYRSNTGNDANGGTSERPRRHVHQKLSAKEAFELNERRTEQTTAKYRKLEMLWPAVQEGEKDAIKEWLDVAGELVDDFRNTRALYPSERGKPFLGFVSTAERRARAVSERVRIEKMQARLQETLGMSPIF